MSRKQSFSSRRLRLRRSRTSNCERCFDRDVPESALFGAQAPIGPVLLVSAADPLTTEAAVDNATDGQRFLDSGPGMGG
jgi:hypothetical protein